MLKIDKIYIYPIKGLKGISVSSANILKEGLEHDRRWMLIDDAGTFISQRTDPKMTQFVTAIVGQEISIAYEDDVFNFSINEHLDLDLAAKVWEHDVLVQEVSLAASRWFTVRLGKSVKLVKQKSDAVRIKKYSTKEGSTPVSFADGYPMLILGTASMDLLNSKLEHKINADRFRANILVGTTIPHKEDSWSYLNIGSSQIEVIKPCARCQVININQSTGESSKEVLKIISTYRRIENKVYFGANASCIIEGVIKLGDKIFIKE